MSRWRRMLSMAISIAMMLVGLFGLWLSIKSDVYFGALPYGSAFLLAGGFIILLSDLAERRNARAIADDSP